MMTERQEQILDFIRLFQREKGVPPSFAWTGMGPGLHAAAVLLGACGRLLAKRGPGRPPDWRTPAISAY